MDSSSHTRTLCHWRTLDWIKSDKERKKTEVLLARRCAVGHHGSVSRLIHELNVSTCAVTTGRFCSKGKRRINENKVPCMYCLTLNLQKFVGQVWQALCHRMVMERSVPYLGMCSSTRDPSPSCHRYVEKSAQTPHWSLQHESEMERSTIQRTRRTHSPETCSPPLDQLTFQRQLRNWMNANGQQEEKKRNKY